MADKFILDQHDGTTESVIFDSSSDRVDIVKSADITDVLEINEQLRNQGNNGYGPTGEFKQVASIPAIMVDKWAKGLGMTTDQLLSPEYEDLFNRLLNCHDNYKFRTSMGRI